MTYVVKAATLQDAEKMVGICEENLVENKQENNLSQSGFLVTRLTSEVARKMIADEKNHLALILQEGDQAMGYLTGCDISEMDLAFQNHVKNFLQLKNSSRIFYHKQIAKKINAKKVGEKLLLAMFDEARKRGYREIICKIVHEPFFNQASVSFHQKFGFNEIGKIEENGRVLGIYLKTF